MWTISPSFSKTSRAEISFERSIGFNLLGGALSRRTFDRVSWLLVAVYSHNLAAIINCDYEITHRPPRELLLPGCRTSRLIESQVSINYQGVLDCICSVPPCATILPTLAIIKGRLVCSGESGKKPKINVKWIPSHPRVARPALGRVVKLTNIILNTLGSQNLPDHIVQFILYVSLHSFQYFYRELPFCTVCIVNLTNMIVIVFAF